MIHKVVKSEGFGAKDDPFILSSLKLKSLSSRRVSEAGNTGGDNAFYGGILPDKVAYYEYPCHANMNQLKDCKVAFSKFVRPNTRLKASAATKAYFLWITGPASPWKLSLDLGMSMDDREEFTQKYWYKNGFVFDRLDRIPSNVLHQFLVASRMPKEWPQEIIRWFKWVKAGVSPEMAFFHLSLWNEQSHNKGTFYLSRENRYDWPLDTATCDEDYLRNFLAHKMNEKKFNRPFAVSCNYTPVNVLWGNNNRPIGISEGGIAYYVNLDKQNYVNILTALYRDAKKIGEIQLQSGFGNNISEYQNEIRKKWTIKEADLISILKEEEKRFGTAA